MARPRAGSELTLSQLESILADRHSQLDKYNRDRAKLMKEVEAIDEKIAKLGGAARGGKGPGRGVTAGGRVRNEKSLVETMSDVLSKSGKPMGVGDIVQAILDSGYRSNSANFRGIVNQTLIKERKHFVNAGRGVYGVKK